jgi:D-aspartate ligase
MGLPVAAPGYLPRVVLLHPNDGALAVARALHRRGVEIWAFPDERHAYVLAARGVRGRVLPDVRERPDVWLGELDALADQGGGVVLPGSDIATGWLATSRSEISPALWTFESKDGVHLALMTRPELYRIAAEAGIRTPAMWHVTSQDGLAALLDSEVAYPCVVEAALGAGSTRVETRDELRRSVRALLDSHLDVVVTQVVPGPGTAVEGAVTIRDREGAYTLEYGLRRLRQWPPSHGAGSLLTCADVPEMRALTRRLLDHAGFHGLSSCTAKRHAGTGELYLTGVDVRIPAGYGLSQACGADGAWRLYATLAELPMAAAPRPVPGRKAALPPDLPAAWHQVRTAPRSLGGVLASWRGMRDLGVLSLRDPRPALTMLAARHRSSSRSR